jgi:hypothetical protein
MSASSSNTTDNRESAVQTDDEDGLTDNSSDWEDSAGEESRPEDEIPQDGKSDSKPD